MRINEFQNRKPVSFFCKNLILLLSCLMFFSCDNARNPDRKEGQVKQEKKKLTSVSFKMTDSEFGVVKEGEKVNMVYKFVNTGTEPLIITRVQPGCGCTVTDWPKKPLGPKEEGSISATFDTANRTGLQKKYVFVISNTKPAVTILSFSGEVKKRS